ncbi:DUF58 domain-containing protein [Oscillospiraceae bacterium LCP21S3_A1]
MVKWWKPVALIFITFIFAVSLKNDFVYFLLGFELMLYPAAFCQVLWLSGKVKAQIMIPDSRVFRGETFQVRAELTNSSRFPIPQLMVRLAVRVFPEKEELLLKGKLMLDSREQGCLCFQMDSTHYGCLEIRPDRLIVTDFMGAFQRCCKIDSEKKSMIFIMPESSQEGQSLPEAQGIFKDEDENSEKQGDDIIDVSEIRSYQEGDPLKMVHWKLSARWNELMVREMMDPAKKLTWLYLNLQESPDQPEVRRSPDAWDHFVETVAATSAILLKMEKRHMVLWIDSFESKIIRISVSDEVSRQEMLCRLLRTDSFLTGDDSLLLKEIYLDETKGTCIEINLQGNLVHSKRS